MPHVKQQARAKNPLQTLKRLASYLAQFKTALIIVVIFVFLSALFAIFPTTIVKNLINDGILPLIGQELTKQALKPFYSNLIALAICFVASAMFEYGYGKIMVTVTNKTLNRLRNEIMEKLQRLPLSFFDKHTHGELMSYFTSDVGAVRDAISDTLPSFIANIVTIIGVLVSMIIISPVMTITMLVMSVVMLFFSKVVLSKSGNNFKVQQQSVAKLNGYIEESMAGSKVIKVFTHEQAAIDDFDKINQQARVASTKANIFGGIMGPVSNNLGHINYAICAILGAYLCIYGYLDFGSLITFLQSNKRLSRPLRTIMEKVNSLLNAIAGAERIFDLLDEAEPIDDGNVVLVNCALDKLEECQEITHRWAWKKPDGSLVELKGNVVFNNVDFSYDGKKQVLTDISFYGKPGQKIAFVGATGAGKTTITNLINRFYEISDGEIVIDGINIKDIEKPALRNALSFVLQDTHLFTGSIKDNIRYGKLNASDEEVIKAAVLANAHEFIMMLPHGYDTIINEDGASLSQGQRQLLSIARAACADKPILVLDEATSSIDTRTEKLIEEGMDNLMAGRTTFVIAHRLSTVRNANAIMVMDHGKIIERGDHDDLIKQKGKYYMLYTGQFELD